MEFLIENWFLIVAAVAIIIFVGYLVYAFLKRPTNEQIKSIKEWLLYAVTEAEKELGSGTGKLKLRYVYNMFIERFSFISKIITFEMFSDLVDEALDEMRKMLSTNKAVLEYVEGAPTSENETRQKE